MDEAATEQSAPPADGELRFGFGSNWDRFLSVLDDRRIDEATAALADMLETDDLRGRSFLDIGSGSGLSSLAAMRLGADRVHSFDYDENSVACTTALRDRYHPAAGSWTVERGDATDPAYLERLGTFDVVYSWGVLHHTGAMWTGIDNAARAVAPGGSLFIAIYNDQGRMTRIWSAIKRLYNVSPASLRPPLVALVGLALELKYAWGALSIRDPAAPIRQLAEASGRGMSRWYDLVDWIGGYPFEVARPEELFDFCRERGFELLRLRTVGGGFGCNELVLRRVDA
jgi:SAM-dependent methyltransferase